MSDLRNLLDRGIGGFEPRGDLDRMMRIVRRRRRRRRLITAGTALAMAAAGAGLVTWAFFPDGKSRPAVPRPEPRPASLRPNGVIAFLKPGPKPGSSMDNTDIFTVNPDGTGLRNLTNTAAPERDPAWSPDGSKVAFIRVGMARTSNGSVVDRARLFVMDADGSDPHEIRSCSYPCWILDLAWAPDNHRIAFVEHSARGSLSFATVFVMNGDGTGVRTICSLECGQGLAEPVWSPDGTRIAFSNAGVADFPVVLGLLPSPLYVADSDGSGVSQLTNLQCHLGSKHVGSCPFFDSRPAWSPDGTLISFTRTPAEPTSRLEEVLELVRPDGSALRTIWSCRDPACSFGGPTWSPDGRQMAFPKFGLESSTILLVSAGSGPPRTIRPCVEGSCIPPASVVWSPDGAQLAFLTEERAPSAYAISVDGTGLRLVTSDVGYSLTWLPRTSATPTSSS